MTRFISFTTTYKQEGGRKLWVSAESQLNDWLKENEVEVISWKPCVMEGQWDSLRKGYEPALCIVVEYKKREPRYHQ